MSQATEDYMVNDFKAVYRFYPVGQGLFASGALSAPNNQLRFTWVYDCGTVSSQDLLKASLANFKGWTFGTLNSGKPKLDLVVISHFDRDHISGLVLLLERFSVGTLLLPYMPLWQRLVLAFSEGIDTQQVLMTFFVNPVAYLTGLEDVSIDRLVFVPGSGTEGRAAPSEDPTEMPEEPVTDGRWPLIIDGQQPDDDDDDDDDERADFQHFREEQSARRTKVSMLRTGSSLRVGKKWEFVPYNNPELAPSVDQIFRDAVKERREALLRVKTEEKRKAALVELRDAYDKHFGKGNRNLGSLFLYAGCIGSSRIEYLCAEYRQWELDKNSHLISRWRCLEHSSRNRSGVLYTGDGYLDTSDRLDQLEKYMGDRRIKQLTCLQVMHHGSRRNWHEGVARRLAPDTSVFCADPDRKRFRHPHAEVVRDFLRFGPYLVDKSQGLTVWFRAGDCCK